MIEDMQEIHDRFKNEPVKVYFNLHKKCFSVKSRKSGLVLFHTHNVVILKDVQFKVSEAGRKRVLKEKRKNVHAYVCGTIKEDKEKIAYNSNHMCTYNPYKYNSFMAIKSFHNEWQEIEPKPIKEAKNAIMFCQSETNKPYILAYN